MNELVHNKDDLFYSSIAEYNIEISRLVLQAEESVSSRFALLPSSGKPMMLLCALKLG